MVIFRDLTPNEEIEAFENVILQKSYHFTNRALIREALLHSMPAAIRISPWLETHFCAKFDYGRDRNKSRGPDPLIYYYFAQDIQDVISKVASNNNFRDRAFAIGLDPFLVKNPGQRGVMAGKNVMADAMEATIYDFNKNYGDCERVIAALGLSWSE
ncbi:hypothetical protein N7463_000116 [Penicillium fimorum]|uniref:Uncharacterized protein n=1 Tax=Penicillium fimorum TaxID=1882269 RepID=A0A9W9Y4I7_9EURO|nr:hypothetical protein N7463_000116 [Penicillium fimorum]